MSKHREIFYERPLNACDTVFDPRDETFGPIMAAIQSGDFSKAADLLRELDALDAQVAGS